MVKATRLSGRLGSESVTEAREKSHDDQDTIPSTVSMLRQTQPIIATNAS